MSAEATKHVEPQEKVPKEKVVDTTGAGDSFIGSFAVLFARYDYNRINNGLIFYQRKKY